MATFGSPTFLHSLIPQTTLQARYREVKDTIKTVSSQESFWYIYCCYLILFGNSKFGNLPQISGKIGRQLQQLVSEDTGTIHTSLRPSYVIFLFIFSRVVTVLTDTS